MTPIVNSAIYAASVLHYKHKRTEENDTNEDVVLDTQSEVSLEKFEPEISLDAVENEDDVVNSIYMFNINIF